MEIIKLTEGRFKVITPTSTIPMETTYSIDFLLQQRIDIQRSIDNYVSQRNIELVEVNKLIQAYEALQSQTEIEL